jgi:hypothetical protein
MVHSDKRNGQYPVAGFQLLVIGVVRFPLSTEGSKTRKRFCLSSLIVGKAY